MKLGKETKEDKECAIQRAHREELEKPGKSFRKEVAYDLKEGQTEWYREFTGCSESSLWPLRR